MAHFAELSDTNEVLRVIVVDNSELTDDNGNESEEKGIAFCASLLGGKWVQTSINSRFRHAFAQPGMVYDKAIDAFIEPQPKPWFVLNSDLKWECPFGTHPDTGKPLEDWQWGWLNLVFDINIGWGLVDWSLVDRD